MTMTRFNTGHSLTRALAPLSLSEVRGQPGVVAQMQAFVKSPYATASAPSSQWSKRKAESSLTNAARPQEDAK